MSAAQPFVTESHILQAPCADADEAAACEEAAFVDANLLDILDETLAELERALAQIAAAEADDVKAEAMKWRRISDVSTRRQNELQQALVDREAELKRLMNIIRRVGKLVGEDNPSRVVAAVAAKLRCKGESA